MEPARLRVPLDRRGEDLCRGLEGTKLHQVVPPVEQVLFGRIHACGALIRLGGGDAIVRALVDVAEQVVELRRLLRAQHALDFVARAIQLARLEEGEGEVVAGRVVSRIDCPGALEVRQGRIGLSLLQVEAGERTVRLEAVRIAARGFRQARFGGGQLSAAGFAGGALARLPAFARL